VSMAIHCRSSILQLPLTLESFSGDRQSVPAETWPILSPG
jgi:hypothetical protein